MAYKDPNGGRLYYAKNRDIIIKRNGDYQKRNRVDTNKRNRGKYYRKAHKLTAEEYTKGIAEQNNCCALCGEEFSIREKISYSAPVLDHNHRTGQLRQFLHRGCNVALGIFKDDPSLCRKAAEYLERHKENIMFADDQGNKHGSRFVARKKNEMHSLGATQETAKPEAEDLNEAPKEDQEQVENPQEIVKKHGKAHTIHVKHNHVENKHHVTSQHEDGTTKESEHASPDLAHKHAAVLGGALPQEQGSEAGLGLGGEDLSSASAEHLA